jgi:hypothetical protein
MVKSIDAGKKFERSSWSAILMTPNKIFKSLWDEIKRLMLDKNLNLH